ncbi:MAG: response regulator [Actinomycetota bacterium]
MAEATAPGTPDDPLRLPGRVLVVDDTATHRHLLARAAANLGYETDTAADGDSALAMLAARPLDVVLLDLMMPVLDGFDTLLRIKGDADVAHLPVIVVSAVEDHASLVRCIELGATDYLYKPVDQELLRARLRTSLATKRLRDVELDHLQQVERMTAAATALEAGRYDPAELGVVAARGDALGTLARVFRGMADEVRAREARLLREVAELRIEIDGTRVGARTAEVTASDYYQRLVDEAAVLKRILAGEGEEGDEG